MYNPNALNYGSEQKSTGFDILTELSSDFDPDAARMNQLKEIANQELNKAFNNPMTEEQFDEYTRLTEIENQNALNGCMDQKLEKQLNDMLSEHSAVAKDAEEFSVMLQEMHNRYPNIDFEEMYYEHELSHHEVAMEEGFIDHGYRIVILRSEDGGLQFVPAQASEPQPDWSAKEYFEKQLKVLSAPGDDMSTDDRAEYEYYKEQLDNVL